MSEGEVESDNPTIDTEEFEDGLDFSKLDNFLEEFEKDRLEDFSDSNYIDDSRIHIFEKYARLRNTLLSITPILMITILISAAIFFSIYQSTEFGELTLVYNTTIPIGVLLVVFIGIIPLIPMILAKRFFTKAQEMDYNAADWTLHKIASAIKNFMDGDYPESLDDLQERNINEIHMHTFFRNFDNTSNHSTLTSTTDGLLKGYIEKVRKSSNIEDTMENTFTDFISPIIAEITAVEEDDQRDLIESIEEFSAEKTSYREAIKRAFDFNITLDSIAFRGLMLILFASIGFGVFHFIDSTLGMITTVILYSSFEILINS